MERCAIGLLSLCTGLTAAEPAVVLALQCHICLSTARAEWLHPRLTCLSSCYVPVSLQRPFFTKGKSNRYKCPAVLVSLCVPSVRWPPFERLQRKWEDRQWRLSCDADTKQRPRPLGTLCPAVLLWVALPAGLLWSVSKWDSKSQAQAAPTHSCSRWCLF